MRWSSRTKKQWPLLPEQALTSDEFYSGTMLKYDMRVG